MRTEVHSGTHTSPQAEAERIIASLRRSVESGEQHWFIALLEGAGQWPLAEEDMDGRRYRYLIDGEAFDWLLLAERLCEELRAVIPADELEELLMRGRFPVEIPEGEFRSLLGPAKHRAYLNFFYGVQVEEALQLRVAQEVHKERLSQVWHRNGHIDEEVCHRIYGATRQQLLGRFRRQRDLPADSLSISDLHEFTYWLFKLRVNSCDPARVASDTRKGLAMMAQLGRGPMGPL